MSTYGLSLQVPQKVVYKFCKEMLDEIEKKDSVKAKYLLKLISEISSWIGGSRASDLCESCVRLTSLGSPTISADAMRCISGLLQVSCIVINFVSHVVGHPSYVLIDCLYLLGSIGLLVTSGTAYTPNDLFIPLPYFTLAI